MKKNVLLGFAVITFVSLQAQTSIKRTAPLNAYAKKAVDNNPIICDHAFSQKSTAKNVTNKVAATTYKRIGRSPNVLSVQATETRALQYISAINTVGFVHRVDGTLWPGVSNGNTGTIAYAWTSNNGTLWDSTVVAADATHLHRYPAGTMYNPSGNTIPANAFAVSTGPWHPGTNWQGVYFASKPLNGTKTSNGTVIYSDNLALQPTQRKQDFARVDMQVTTNGVIHVLGDLAKNVNDVSSNQAYGWRGAMINKGVFSAGIFTWTLDSLKPNVKLSTNGDKNLSSTPNMAWSEDGLTGYVIFYGVDATAAIKSSQNTHQPLVYKTTNGGTTWVRHAILFDFTTLPAINDRLFPTRGVTPSIGKPFVTSGEGSSATVDANGQLHLFVSVNSAFSDNIDSLGYTYSPNFNQIWNYMFDLNTTATGWNAMIIDSLSCDGPTSGASGTSQWTGAVGKVAYDARLQLSRTSDGRYITYAWADSDSTIAVSHASTFPDVYMKSFDVTTSKFTCKKNMSKGKTGVELNSYFFYASTASVKPNATTILIPTTVSRSDDASNNGDLPVSHYYINDNTFSTTEYTVAINAPGCTISTGVSIKEQSSIVTGLKFYPNPTSVSSTLEVHLNDNSKIEVSILNSLGQVVFNSNVEGISGNNIIDLNISGLNNGLYFYQVKAGDTKIITNKFIIAK